MTAQIAPLRVARREFTRGRLMAAAREMFFEKGFAGAKLEDIALAAGTQRSTLYTHFRDKDQIITALTEEYTVEVAKVIARLPTAPTRAEIDAWIEDMARFVEEQRTPTELLVFMGHMIEVPPAVLKYGRVLLDAFAARLPAFERACRPDDELAHAWAQTVLRELGWALCYKARNGDTEAARAKLTVAAELFSRFVQHGAD